MSKPSHEPSALRRIFLIQLGLIIVATALVAVAAPLESGTGRTIGFFWFAFIAGSFGGSIGLLRRSRADKKVLRDLGRSWITLLIPHLYGGMLAGLMYFLFVSGILSATSKGGLLTSNLFPDFVLPDAGAPASIRAYLALRPASLPDAGKLLVWCFIAGYSEGFVIGILDHLRSVERGGGGEGGGGGGGEDGETSPATNQNATATASKSTNGAARIASVTEPRSPAAL